MSRNNGRNTIRVATWNVNGIRARLATVSEWLRDTAPDVVCLQEIKTEEKNFPAEAFEDLGYNLAIHGQKGFNGVAILSRLPIDEIRRGLPTWPDEEQARYIEAVVSTETGALRVASVYAPNGNPVNTEKFDYKLRWLEAFHAHAADLLKLEERFALGGDYNIIPTPRDAKNPEEWEGDALFSPQARAAWRKLINLGLVDAALACKGDPRQFTFWDYKGGAWQKNDGIRIDFVLLSPQAADAMVDAGTDKRVRAWEKPSDHVPLLVELDPRHQGMFTQPPFSAAAAGGK